MCYLSFSFDKFYGSDCLALVGSPTPKELVHCSAAGEFHRYLVPQKPGKNISRTGGLK